jgi:hypothetical protein
VSVAHTDADVDRHLEVFADVAPALAQAQKQPRVASSAGH